MTLFSITDTSDYLNELLSGETSGTVHSVYRKTINLSIGGTLAALQAKGSPISPISLITTLLIIKSKLDFLLREQQFTT